MINRVEFDRPDWVEFNMGLAFAVARKSHDAQTKVGCVITSDRNRILGIGFNGFPEGVDDFSLPNLRPTTDEQRRDPMQNKYPWMIHAEANALANCEHKPHNGIAYVTTPPCTVCLPHLWQHGIRKIYVANRPQANFITEQDIWFINAFVDKTGIEIYYVRPNLSWLQEVADAVNVENFYVR